MGMAAILVMWPGSFDKLSFPHPTDAPYEIWLIDPVVSEEKMFKECGRRRTTEAYISYKLTKWAFGSGDKPYSYLRYTLNYG